MELKNTNLGKDSHGGSKTVIEVSSSTETHRNHGTGQAHKRQPFHKKQGRVLLVVPQDSLIQHFKTLGGMSCVEILAPSRIEEVIEKIGKGFEVILYEKSLYTQDVADTLSSTYQKTSFKQVKIFSEKSARFSEEFLIKKVKEPCLP